MLQCNVEWWRLLNFIYKLCSKVYKLKKISKKNKKLFSQIIRSPWHGNCKSGWENFKECNEIGADKNDNNQLGNTLNKIINVIAMSLFEH